MSTNRTIRTNDTRMLSSKKQNSNEQFETLSLNKRRNTIKDLGPILDRFIIWKFRWIFNICSLNPYFFSINANVEFSQCIANESDPFSVFPITERLVSTCNFANDAKVVSLCQYRNSAVMRTTCTKLW